MKKTIYNFYGGLLIGGVLVGLVMGRLPRLPKAQEATIHQVNLRHNEAAMRKVPLHEYAKARYYYLVNRGADEKENIRDFGRVDIDKLQDLIITKDPLSWDEEYEKVKMAVQEATEGK